MRKLWLGYAQLVGLALLLLGSCGQGPTATPLPPTPQPPTATPEPTSAPPTPTPRPPAATPEPTVAPPTVTSSPAPTLQPPATHRVPTVTASAGPVVRAFRVTPTTTLNLGDELTITWEAAGERAELCPISGPGPVEARCQEVSLAGSTLFVTDEAAMAYTAFGLRVTAGGTFTWSMVDVHLQCQDWRPWFFAGAPQRCPAGAAHLSRAAGQYFEHGLMVWREDPDSFYIFYRGLDEWGFQVMDWISDIRLKPGASPDNRIGQNPPAGLYEPVSGFGMVWRGEVEGVRADVRDRLGWAAEPESAFDTAYQCETTFYPGLWDCFLRGPRGEILYLRPDSTAQVRWLWEEWQPIP